jgi:hypothetical protein
MPRITKAGQRKVRKMKTLKTLAIAAALAAAVVPAKAQARMFTIGDKLYDTYNGKTVELHKSGYVAESALCDYAMLLGCENNVVDINQAKAKVIALWNKAKSEGYDPKGTDPKAGDLDHRFDIIYKNESALRAAKLIYTRDSDCHKYFDELMSK